jgi:nuclear transport factor 2 (NTF2) superfamily protein
MRKPFLPLAAAALLVSGILAGACQTNEAPVVEDEDSVEEFAERYAAAWSSQDPASVAAFYAAEGSLAVNEAAPAVGREALTEVAQGFMTDLPDMVVLFDRLEERDGRVLFHWTLEATNSGPGGTGMRVRVSGYESWLLDENGLIAESKGHFPTAEYERQLEVGYDGAAPSG